MIVATGDKVTAALADPTASDMKIKDLKAHLNSLKQMFIEKQKIMDGINAKTAKYEKQEDKTEALCCEIVAFTAQIIVYIKYCFCG